MLSTLFGIFGIYSTKGVLCFKLVSKESYKQACWLTDCVCWFTVVCVVFIHLGSTASGQNETINWTVVEMFTLLHLFVGLHLIY